MKTQLGTIPTRINEKRTNRPQEVIKEKRPADIVIKTGRQEKEGTSSIERKNNTLFS